MDVGDAWLASRLDALGPFDRLVWLLPETPGEVSPASLIAAQNGGILRGLALIRALLDLGYGDRTLDLTAITRQCQAVSDGDIVDATHAGVWGLVGSAAKEYPRWRVRLVDVKDEAARLAAVGAHVALAADPDGNGVAWRDGTWFREVCLPCELPPPAAPVYRRRGVYVIVGGAGGIGAALTERLIREHDARVVWLGRRAADEVIEASRARLATWGEPPTYLSADARDVDALRAARDAILSRHGAIDGVVHATLVMSGSDLAGMTRERFVAVTSAKIDTAVLTAHVFAGHVRDFLVFFSSIQALEKTRRQSNYATASTFVDAYAHQLRDRMGCAVKVIDWGYWGNTGIARELASFQHWLADAGMGSIDPAEGFDALERLLGSDAARVAYLKTHRAGALQGVTLVADGVPRSATARPAQPRIVDAPAATTGTPWLREHVRQVVLEKLSGLLLIELSDIQPHASFAEYGLDSLQALATVDAINAALGTRLTSTSMFDFNSVNRLVAHIVDAHAPVLAGVTVDAAPVDTMTSANMPVDAPSCGDDAPAPTTPPALPAALAPIAIVGLSGRYPRSPDVATLWTHLAAGDDLTEPVTRWDMPAILGDTPYCPRGGFLDGIECFDAQFFSISGTEATHMDPQQRLFLEEAWKALEEAGHVGASIAGQRCGVYAGYNGGDYHLVPASMEGAPPQAIWGTATSLVSARIAYHLDLQGPAITVDTACSSSLVAMHLACQALRAGEVDLALAGGVFVQCTPSLYLGGERAGMLSASGRCYTFDDRADGFVPGEGVGVVVLKRLDDALADGDHLHGVIRGSGINQDGATNGITAPSAVSQERLEREVYDRFGIDADGIQLVEAHGTGTKLGDPVEVHALTRAFRRDTARESYCAIGSIKSNLGHTTAAAGVASVLKVLLCLRHAQIAPSLHYEHRNRHIDLAGSPFQVATRLRPWHVAPGQTRRAAVSSFGLSGTNAHLVIEQAPAHARTTAPRPGYLWALSARSEAQLRQQVERLLAHLDAEPAIDCGNVAYTLLLGRRHFACRLTCVARHRDEFVQRLRTWLEHGRAPQVRTSCCTPLEDGGQAALKGYGNQCLRELGESLAANDYLDRLAAIAELFGQGYELDYASGFASQPHGRLSLPTYPFAPTPYWVEAPGTPPSAAKAEEAQAPEALSFQERWEPAAAPAATATPRRLLVIGTDAAVATAAAAALGAAQAEAEIASVDGDAVAAAIEAEAGWEGIVYAGAWAGPADAAQGTAMYAAVQALAAAGVTPGHLVLCAAYADGPSRAHAESWIGLARSLGVLVPDWTVTVLVGEGVAAEPGSDWAARVWTELAGGDGGAVHRAGAVHERLRVVAHALAAPVPTLRQGGVYWITGGAGGLGLHVARHLRERYAAKLVLSGRRALDEAARATLVAALGETDWLYVAADVTDAAAMGAGVAEAVARWGAIEGVVHAAGVLDPAPLTAKTASALAGVLAPKVRGSAVLDAVMAAQPLAFVCYFSSSAAVLGDFGGGDYAMGNRFQMAWAQWVEAPGGARRVAINWPLWAAGGVQAGVGRATRVCTCAARGQVALPVGAGAGGFVPGPGAPHGGGPGVMARRPGVGGGCVGGGGWDGAAAPG
ncbi:SDR family NAD(P)-dependent oxidoreductase, partial [Xanthomonas citri]|uniref:SDR family NAD(P)-dependent oxidoreductase n=1 Tax=Xanthomonas citri TaxID=346 RepID=UPI0021DA7185